MSGNRGKVAEDKVKRAIADLSTSAFFAGWRLPDAHAGSRVPTLSDFIVFSGGVGYLLEVKEVAHDYRLPVGNFKIENRNRMRMFEQAGAMCVIMIYHSTTKKWRALPLEFFGNLDSGSWDFRSCTEFLTAKEALKHATNLE